MVKLTKFEDITTGEKMSRKEREMLLRAMRQFAQKTYNANFIIKEL